MAEQQTPSSSTLLDALRRRLLPEVEPSVAKRLSDIGIGMLASDSPSFFTALGQGLRNANEAENRQLQMLRQMADSEEQSADRKARLELERAKQAYEQDPNNHFQRFLTREYPAPKRQTKQHDAFSSAETIVISAYES